MKFVVDLSSILNLFASVVEIAESRAERFDEGILIGLAWGDKFVWGSAPKNSCLCLVRLSWTANFLDRFL